MSDYIEDGDVKVVAEDLIVKYPELFNHIDPKRVLFAREISRSQKTKPGGCLSVKPPFNLLNPDVIYIVVVYHKSGWDDLGSAQQTALVMHQLMHIDPNFDGSMCQHDIDDWAFLVDNLGSDYLENNGIPDLRSREVPVIEDLDAPEEQGDVDE